MPKEWGLFDYLAVGVYPELFFYPTVYIGHQIGLGGILDLVFNPIDDKTLGTVNNRVLNIVWQVSQLNGRRRKICTTRYD